MMMANSILILGESGTGKSTSLRNLPPEETLVINVLGKPFPFRGAKSKYKPLSQDGLTGNYYASDDPSKIQRLIKKVNDERPEIKYLVLDDFGFTISHSFMRKSHINGFGKFADIARETFGVFEAIQGMRDDLHCIMIMHTEVDQNGRHKAKTIGKAIDNYVNIEGTFTYVFHALTAEGNYFFLTNNDGQHTCKTPKDCFEEMKVDNDLYEIIKVIKAYNEGE
jgi:hypothetical protein